MMEFKNEVEKVSYALGLNVAEYFRSLPYEVNFAMAARALSDAAAGKPEMTQDEYHATMQKFQKLMQEAAEQHMAEMAKKNKAAGDKFLAENAKKDGVKTTPSGLQYMVITEGSGDVPSSTDIVKVHYTGTLIDGRVFDSSVSRGVPAQFGVNQVIPGWTEALQMMKVGSKYKIFLPAEIAYGERGAGDMIQPNSTLIFEVELLDIIKK